MSHPTRNAVRNAPEGVAVPTSEAGRQQAISEEVWPDITDAAWDQITVAELFAVAEG